MGPENKELMKTTSMLKEYRSEMEGMIIEVRNEEAALGDFKRRTTKDAMGLKCGGLLEMAEKLTVSYEGGGKRREGGGVESQQVSSRNKSL